MTSDNADQIIARIKRKQGLAEPTNSAKRIADKYIARDGGEPNKAKSPSADVGETIIPPEQGEVLLDDIGAFLSRFVIRRRVHSGQGHGLRDRLSRWAATVADKLVGVWPKMPDGVEDRDADMWEPLLAVADAVGGNWPKLASDAAVTFVTSAKEREPSLGIRLLADTRTVFGNEQEMPTEAILRELHSLKESPWSDLKGKPLNERGLALRLRQYEVKPKVLGGGAHRGYRREDLHDAWERYLAPLSPPDEKSEQA